MAGIKDDNNKPVQTNVKKALKKTFTVDDKKIYKAEEKEFSIWQNIEKERNSILAGRFYSNELESIILSTLIYDNTVREDVINILDITDFYYKKWQTVFELIKELYLKEIDFDNIYFLDYAKSKIETGELDYNEIQNLLMSETTLPLNVIHICKRIKNYTKLRKLYLYGYEIQQLCNSENILADDIIDKMETDIYEMVSKGSINEIVESNVKQLIESIVGGMEKDGIKSGYQGFDSMTGGFLPGNLYIIAGRPSDGKTALALNIAKNTKETGEAGIGIISLEMSEKELLKRFIASECKVDLLHLVNNQLSKSDLDKIEKHKEEFEEKYNRLFIMDNVIALEDIVYTIKKLVREKDCIGVIIDYIQLVENKKAQTRELEVASIPRRLKQLCKQLGIFIIALSQMNRKIEERTNKEPRLSDLRESGALEQDGDLIAFIYRPNKKDEPRVAELICAKQRNGPTFYLNLDFMVDYQIIKEL